MTDLEAVEVGIEEKYRDLETRLAENRDRLDSLDKRTAEAKQAQRERAYLTARLDGIMDALIVVNAMLKNRGK